MKNYIAGMIDLTGDQYLSPRAAAYGDGSGTHQRNLTGIRAVSVHHDAAVRPHNYDSVARYRQEARAHYDRLGPGLQYHYKIDNVGQIFQIRPLTTWLYVIGSSRNVDNIAICLDGYFHAPNNQKATREQYEALSQLINYLMTQRPDIPNLNYPDVFPHSYFSSTACCGDTLRPYVLQVVDTATAGNIPADAVYDWPELQPRPQAPVVDVPSVPNVPVNVDPIQPPVTADPMGPAYVQDPTFIPATYIAQVKTHLDGLDTGKRFADYEPAAKFDFVARFILDGGEKVLMTAYGIKAHEQGKRELAGVPEKDVVIYNPGKPIEPDTTPTPTPPVPETPPVVAVPDQAHLAERITAIEKIVERIKTFLETIFNRSL